MTSIPDHFDPPLELAGRADHARLLAYFATVLAMVLLWLLIADSDWHSGPGLHAFFDGVAVGLAAFITLVLLAHAVATRSRFSFFVGIAFAGTAMLDLVHGLVTIPTLAGLWSSPPETVGPWSWNLSRLYLALMLTLGCARWLTAGEPAGEPLPRRLPMLVLALIIAAGALVALLLWPLPTVYVSGRGLTRPVEAAAGLLFLVALTGLLRSGRWRAGPFAHWLVLSLVLAAATQVPFMASSRGLFDAMFDTAHAAKLASYLCLAVGTLAALRTTFTDLQQRTRQLAAAKTRLEIEVVQREQAETRLRAAAATLEQRVIERTRDLTVSIEERRRSEERLRLLLESTPDALIVAGEDGRIVLANAEAYRTFGYEAGTLMGQPVDLLVPASQRDVHARVREQYHGTPARRMGAGRALSGRRRDGSEFPVEVSLSPLRTAEGLLIAAAVRDVTARRRTEALIARFGRLVDSALSEIYVFDADSLRFTMANAGARRNLGYSMAELEALTPLDLTPEFDAGSFAAILAPLRNGEREQVVFETVNRRKDGSRYPVDVHLQLTREAGGPPAFVAVLENITERKRFESDLRALNATLEARVAERTAQLEAANRELEGFSYSVSHDLRAPLRHLSGFARLLQRDAGPGLDDEARRHLDIISGAAERMGELIDGLLAFSRLGRADIVAETLDLDALVQDVIAGLQTEIGARPVEWQIEPLPAVRGDRTLLRAVFGNLVHNAVKFTAGRAPARIEIGAVAGDPAEVVLFVRDNGAGFDMNYAGKLFGVFQRLHSEDEFPGHGVGLALVRRIVHRHGGRVWAESAPGAGATFYLALPRPGDNGGEHA
ncbi:MAG: PAS domain S-box protein [Gammaproteobacteria bacterium]|nr:PAS domain S-box protein [Gammaproteobacteria bacterium]